MPEMNLFSFIFHYEERILTMKSKGILKWAIRVALVLSIVALYIGCGGGGGGDSGNGSATTEDYTGKKSEAALTNANAEAVLLGAYASSQAGRNSGRLSAQAAAPASGIAIPLPVYLNDSIQDLYNKGALSFGSPAKSSDYDYIDYSDCAGSDGYATITATSDKTAVLIYHNYCKTSLGSITFSGKVNLTLKSESSSSTVLVMKYVDCTLSSNCFSVTASGTATVTITSSSLTSVYNNFYILDNKTDKTSMTDDYTVYINKTYRYMTIQGKYYYPDYGYVNITTDSAIYFDTTGSYSGVLVATGSDSSSAYLTFHYDYTYSIDVDESGDGSFTTIIDSKSLTTDCD
jgi:hypothetical protein